MHLGTVLRSQNWELEILNRPSRLGYWLLINLYMNLNIWLPLLWSSWSWALGQDSVTCADLARGQWLWQLCSLRSFASVPQKAWSYFPSNCWKHSKNIEWCWGFFSLTERFFRGFFSKRLEKRCIFAVFNVFADYAIEWSSMIPWKFCKFENEKPLELGMNGFAHCSSRRRLQN